MEILIENYINGWFKKTKIRVGIPKKKKKNLMNRPKLNGFFGLNKNPLPYEYISINHPTKPLPSRYVLYLPIQFCEVRESGNEGGIAQKITPPEKDEGTS